MANMYDVLARRVPPKLRKHILEEKFIDKALNVQVENSPMEFLFDAYHEFVDNGRGEYNDWDCHKCRGHVLNVWQKMKPYLERIQAL
jgi:hypothetical protein